MITSNIFRNQIDYLLNNNSNGQVVPEEDLYEDSRGGGRGVKKTPY
jgi:hypothetical protein